MGISGIGTTGCVVAGYTGKRTEGSEKFRTADFMKTMEKKASQGKAIDYDEQAFEMVGPNAPQEVKDAWMCAAKEVNANGLGIKGNGMMSHISQMMVQRVYKMYRGETGNFDILGNTVESAIKATEQALYDLDHPLAPAYRSIEAEQARIKEREFYVAFLEKLGKRTRENTAENSFAGQMENIGITQNKGITLHISNPEDGEAIGSMGDSDSSVTVYKTKDFHPENPVYKVKVWDVAGNVTERMVDISKIDPKNCDEIEMFAYSSHLTDTGECPNAQRSFMGAKYNHNSENSGSFFGKENWMDIVGEIMQMQYDAGNMKGYLDYKKFWDFLD